MRIVPLTVSVVRPLLARRRGDPAAERVARRILADVRRRGDRALVEWSRRLDALRPAPRAGFRVEAGEMHRARRAVPPEFLRAICCAARNIACVARRQLPRPWTLEVAPGVRVGQMVRPLDSAGCYVPGGRYALVSTLLMTVVPAQVAGVGRIVVVCPRPNAELLAAAGLLGITELYRLGGAQAIAALACGTESIAPVTKIFGPGNRYVTAAKRLVSADCATDLPAGPTELVVVAARGNPRFIAADLVAQAEHAADAVALLVTPSRRLAVQVQREVARQLLALPAGNPARRLLGRRGAILLSRDLAAAMDFVNRFAPEHLSLPGAETALLRQVRAAGSVFLGSRTAQPLGDYATGSNHVLPTAGWARARGGLSAADFVKCIAVQQTTARGLARLGPVAVALARGEGLEAHARAIEVRR